MSKVILEEIKQKTFSASEKMYRLTSPDKQPEFKKKVLDPLEEVVESNLHSDQKLDSLISSVNNISSQIFQELDHCKDIAREFREYRTTLQKLKRRNMLLKPDTEKDFIDTLRWYSVKGNEEDLQLIEKVKQNLPFSSESIERLFELAEEEISRRLFQLKGYDNPLCDYPATVVAIGYYKGSGYYHDKLVAVYLDSANSPPSFLELEPDAVYDVNYDNQKQSLDESSKQALEKFNYRRDRLFALSEKEILRYEAAKEKEFFSGLLKDETFAQHNPFLRRSLAKITEDIDIIQQELIRCIKYLKDESPDMIPSWYEMEKENLAYIWQRHNLEFPTEKFLLNEGNE